MWRKPQATVKSRKIISHINFNFDRPYGLIGRCGVVSSMSGCSGEP